MTHKSTQSTNENPGNELTICSVYSSNDTKRELEMNHGFVRAMNPNTSIHWLVADATDRGETKPIDPEKFTVLEGLRTSDLEKTIGWRSVQHAGSLNKLFPHVSTRYLLVLDPDFYVVRHHWIRDILAHMKRNDLALFGSPWHPRDYAKPRYFFSTHFFVFDLEKIPTADINFLPGDIEEWRVNKRIHPILRALVTDRAYIGASRDSGYRLFRALSRRSDLKRDSLTPVFRPRKDWDPIKNKLASLNTLIEIFLPERYCYHPKKRGAYSKLSFADLGLTGVADLHFEEYLWLNKPFAIHLRGTKAGYYKGGGDARFARDISRIASLLDSYPAPRNSD